MESTSEDTGGYMGGCTLMASAIAEAAPQETPTEAREKGNQRIGNAWTFRGFGRWRRINGPIDHGREIQGQR